MGDGGVANYGGKEILKRKSNSGSSAGDGDEEEVNLECE
jgi:hypothetical protein